MDNKLCLGGPCVLMSLESGAGLRLAESEIEIHPSTSCCEEHRLHWWPHLVCPRWGEEQRKDFEVGGSCRQRGKSLCVKWPLAILGGEKDGSSAAGDEREPSVEDTVKNQRYK